MQQQLGGHILNSVGIVFGPLLYIAAGVIVLVIALVWTFSTRPKKDHNSAY
jgi:hypothetical protein